MPIEKIPTEIPSEVITILDRLEEIKNMDKSDLTPSERKHLETKLET